MISYCFTRSLYIITSCESGALKVLIDARIRTIMCTGDNMFTALSVAHECKMISSDATVIVVEVAEENMQPTFTYAEFSNQHVNDAHVHPSVCNVSVIINSVTK